MPDGYDPRLLAGIRYHYLGRYWDSHFMLEKLWLASEGVPRQVAQVLIIAGAATIHSLWQRWHNVAILCDRGLEHLAGCPAGYLGLDLGRLAQELVALREEARSLAEGRKERFDTARIPQLRLSDVDPESLMSDARYELPTARDASPIL